jgi:hypothetical protein
MFSKRKIKKFFRAFFPKQVKFTFPIEVLSKYVDRKWDVPEGYTIVSPSEETNLKEWGDLLARDTGFGTWTPERVKRVVVDQMIAPHAGTLLYYKGSLVGCSSTADKSTTRKKIGVGEWLALDRSHRGLKGLSHALAYRTLAFFAEAGYDKVYGYSDEDRLSVLYLHLTNGAVPVYNSISSFFKWRRIYKRLNPLLKRAEKRASKA